MCDRFKSICEFYAIFFVQDEKDLCNVDTERLTDKLHASNIFIPRTDRIDANAFFGVSFCVLYLFNITYLSNVAEGEHGTLTCLVTATTARQT